ncbi:MAG: hypothetical protein AAF202_03845, partial [Pseudomonadota bacterium]
FSVERKITGGEWGKGYPDRPLVLENLFGLAARSQAAYDLLYRFEEELPSLTVSTKMSLERIPDEERNQKLLALLIEQVSRFQIALANGIHLELTPAKVMDQASQPTLDPDSETSIYFRSFTRPDEQLHILFAGDTTE